MPLDPQKLLSLPPLETLQHLSRRDTILYALGVGATELEYTYEENLQALPTMAVVLAYPGFFWKEPAYGVDWRRILHGETSIQIHSPLPVEGQLRGVTTIGPILDKGAHKGAVCYQTRRIYLTDRLIATVQTVTFHRGEGGFGGANERQPKPRLVPDRPPDSVHTLPTLSIQAKIYRLSGDYNPLHIDPVVAQAAGFPRPILHGLCTFGVVGRSLLSSLCEYNPMRIKEINVRFTSPVYPGDTIRTEIWRVTGGAASFRSIAVESNIVVLNNGYVEYQ